MLSIASTDIASNDIGPHSIYPNSSVKCLAGGNPAPVLQWFPQLPAQNNDYHKRLFYKMVHVVNANEFKIPANLLKIINISMLPYEFKIKCTAKNALNSMPKSIIRMFNIYG